MFGTTRFSFTVFKRINNEYPNYVRNLRFEAEVRFTPPLTFGSNAMNNGGPSPLGRPGFALC